MISERKREISPCWRSFLITFIVLIILLFSSSCSKGTIGYFVVIWPPEKSALKSGDLVKVISQSEIRNIYIVEKKENKIREEIPKFSGRFFNKKKDAQKFLSQYEPYVDMFAYPERSLNIRNAPDITSGREYRLRPSQVVKVINKLPNPFIVNNVSGYWIEVLTEDGFDGFCFDKYLTIYKQESAAAKENNEEKYLNSFFTNRWYPSSYLEIIDNNKIVIEKLKTGEGLFPNRDSKKIVIQTQKERIEFSFDNIRFSGNNNAVFMGSPVEVIFYSTERIYLKYTYNGVDFLSFYTTLEKPVDQYIEMEIERRNNALDLFYKRGKYLTSDLYGTIKLEEKRRFIWTGNLNLVPDVIPFNYGSSGTIRNRHHLGNSVNKKFDGILSFAFETSGREMVFAYFFTENGVQLTYVPEKNIENAIIHTVPDDSHIFYFRQNLSPQE